MENMEPMFVIHNISIATDDDIIQFGDDVNIHPVYLSRAIIICGKFLKWLEKTIILDHNFCQFLVSWFGNSLMATECTCKVLEQCNHRGLVAVDEGTKYSFWYTEIHSMTKFFTTFNFHDYVFIWNYYLDIVLYSGLIRAFESH